MPMHSIVRHVGIFLLTGPIQSLNAKDVDLSISILAVHTYLKYFKDDLSSER